VRESVLLFLKILASSFLSLFPFQLVWISSRRFFVASVDLKSFYFILYSLPLRFTLAGSKPSIDVTRDTEGGLIFLGTED
jgi:hypothetical protein